MKKALVGLIGAGIFTAGSLAMEGEWMPYIDADFNKDREVSFGDFLFFAGNFERVISGEDPWDVRRCDLNSGGVIDLGDFFDFAESFGKVQRGMEMEVVASIESTGEVRVIHPYVEGYSYEVWPRKVFRNESRDESLVRVLDLSGYAGKTVRVSVIGYDQEQDPIIGGMKQVRVAEEFYRSGFESENRFYLNKLVSQLYLYLLTDYREDFEAELTFNNEVGTVVRGLGRERGGKSMHVIDLKPIIYFGGGSKEENLERTIRSYAWNSFRINPKVGEVYYSLIVDREDLE